MKWKTLLHTGPIAVVLAWIIIGASWYLNRDWFVFTRDAFSDFGGSNSCCPGLYNYGLITVGVLLALYGVAIAGLGENKLEVSGGGYMVLAGVFLMLIGVFYEGTRPHTFVSTWFFIQADVSLALVTLGLWRRMKTPTSLSGFAAAVAAFPVAIILAVTVGWPSAAVLEAYGVIVIDIIALLVYIDYYRRI